MITKFHQPHNNNERWYRTRRERLPIEKYKEFLSSEKGKIVPRFEHDEQQAFYHIQHIFQEEEKIFPRHNYM